MHKNNPYEKYEGDKIEQLFGQQSAKGQGTVSPQEAQRIFNVRVTTLKEAVQAGKATIQSAHTIWVSDAVRSLQPQLCFAQSMAFELSGQNKGVTSDGGRIYTISEHNLYELLR